MANLHRVNLRIAQVYQQMKSFMVAFVVSILLELLAQCMYTMYVRLVYELRAKHYNTEIER